MPSALPTVQSQRDARQGRVNSLLLGIHYVHNQPHHAFKFKSPHEKNSPQTLVYTLSLVLTPLRQCNRICDTQPTMPSPRYKPGGCHGGRSSSSSSSHGSSRGSTRSSSSSLVAAVAIACFAIQLASPTLMVHASAHWGLAQPTPQGSLGSTLHIVPALQVVVVVGGELYGKDGRVEA